MVGRPATYLRSLVYGSGLHRVLRGLGWDPDAAAPHRSGEWWDGQLAGAMRPYLGGTVTVDVRNALTIELIRHFVPSAESMLDVGCAAGALGRAAQRIGIRRYVGVDISRVALESADRALGEFHLADLCSFGPSAYGPFDVVVFHEVLYYTSVESSVSEVARYTRALRPGGAVLFSMKDDPKCRAILSAVRARFDWAGGVLFQEQPETGRYALREDRMRPPYLLGVLRARTDAEPVRPGGAPAV